MMARGPLTLGTAGHIDHGKSSLIRALTGVDTDRLPQEHERGISIELGYARLVLPSGAALSVVDVPGHERYVRTMVAGATGIDLYLMVIAADDGIMPQTREHAAVLAALDVPDGVVAITKADLADPGRALAQAQELLPGAEPVAVSARTGAGLNELRAALDRVVSDLPGRSAVPRSARLHIDRVFTIHGAGTVVTGTLWTGEIRRGERLQVLPAGRSVRVREVQVHDAPTDAATAGQRVAVNLAGVSRDAVSRGDVLVDPDSGCRETFLIDAELTFADAEPDTGTRLQVHHGTREAPARVAWLGGDFWQLRLEQPLIAVAGDRLVLRQIAPPDTLGGGRVLDAGPRKHGPSRELLARLAGLARGEPPAPAAASGPDPVPGPVSAPIRLGPSALALEARLRESGFEPPLDSSLDAADLAALREAGRAVRISRTLHYHPETVERARDLIVRLAAERGGAVTVSQVRDALGTSRKFAQALLEHLDSERITIRRGDQHLVRRGYR